MGQVYRATSIAFHQDRFRNIDMQYDGLSSRRRATMGA